MKNQYTLDISEHMNKELTDCYRYDKLVMYMNAQILEIASNLFEADKQLLREEAIDKLVD